MARIRTIKPEFWTSEQIVECSTNARLLFVGLWNFCDDSGRHPASCKRLKMEVFPGDGFENDEISEMVSELINQGLLIEYESQCVVYWQVTGWHHQKIDKPYPSKIPSPFDDHSTIIRGMFADHSQTIRDGMECIEEEEKGNGAFLELLLHLRSEKIGMYDAEGPVTAALAKNVTVPEIHAIADYWLANPGTWTVNQLNRRITKAVAGEAANKHWPSPDATGKARNAAQRKKLESVKRLPEEDRDA